MKRTEQNKLCPCGSGRKHRRCCKGKSEAEWLPLQTLIKLIYHPDFYWVINGCIDCKYIEVRIDTRDNHCLIKDRNGKLVDIEAVFERINTCDPGWRGMNKNDIRDLLDKLPWLERTKEGAL